MAKLYVGLDVSDRTTSICVVDGRGGVALEAVADTTPDGIAAVLAERRDDIVAVGLEAGVLAAWLLQGLTERGFPAHCLDPAHAHGVLRVQRNKTDRNDALGLARLLRSGWIKTAHVRSPAAARLRMALVLRASMVRKAVDLEHLLRQNVKAFGVKLGGGARGAFEARLSAAVADDALLKRMTSGVLRVRSLLTKESDILTRRLVRLANADPVCARLMTVPGVGPITALMFRACVDDPTRFRHSAAVAVYFGLTPRRRQSGQYDASGSISKRGDRQMRALLCTSAMMLLRCGGESNLQRWAHGIDRRKKKAVARVAIARKIATVLHRIWISGETFNARRGVSFQPTLVSEAETAG